MHATAGRKLLDRDEVAPIDVRTVRGNRLDLVARVRGPHELAIWKPPLRPRLNHDHIPAPSRPFALDPEMRIPEVEHEVVALVLEHRLKDDHAEFSRASRDRRLGDSSLLVRRQLHDTNTSSHHG